MYIEVLRVKPTCIMHISILSMSTSSLHDADDFLQLVRSRYCPQRTDSALDGASPKATRNRTTSISNSAVQQSDCQFNLHLLQEDIVALYLAGKPLLESASSIRTHFRFRSKAQQSSPHPTK